ncbi:MAG: hypothetical protein Q7S63_02540 [bacterium]|nr:hypothetical protein [bacterium]
MLFCSMLALVCLYVIQINLVVAATYRISGYEKAFRSLSEETKSLQAQEATTRSFKTIEELASAMQFEKVTHVEYIQVGGAVVAQGKVR